MTTNLTPDKQAIITNLKVLIEAVDTKLDKETTSALATAWERAEDVFGVDDDWHSEHFDKREISLVSSTFNYDEELQG